MKNAKLFILYFSLSFFTSTEIFAKDFVSRSGGDDERAIFNKKLTIQGADSLESMSFGAYSWNPDSYYLAAEANVNASTIKYNGWSVEPGNNSENEFTLYNSFGVSLLPGYRFPENNFSLYGRIGLTREDFGYKECKASPGALNSYGINDHQWLNGWRYGLGIEAALKDKLSWRLEYDHIDHQNYTGGGFSLSNAHLHEVAPETNQIELALVYHF